MSTGPTGGSSQRAYIALLLLIAGVGGALYGYDIGIIGAALLYLGKTISLTVAQESLVVAAVLAGGTVSSLIAGILADWIGRKKLMIAAALIFVASVGLIVAARDFTSLVAGRTLQGLSAGMIAVVVPLYLAECLPPAIRGRGTAIFQLVLTIGIAAGLAVGAHYVSGVAALAAAPVRQLREAQDHAWRAMFLTAVYPAIVFLVGSICVTESPRWLMRRGRSAEALAAIRKSRTEEQAELEHREITAALRPVGRAEDAPADSLWQRKYLLPFALACAVLGLTQATGINSILQFLVVILQQAGLPATAAAQAATRVATVNVAFTLVGALLVDQLGRKALLKIGTGGVAVALLVAGAVFYRIASGPAGAGSGHVVTACLMVFIASFAIGPGVCVWLALSELMPTRIRSLGMGLGLLINQGISTVIAALFLPVVQRYGYAPMFFFWAACTIAFFLTAAFLLPETKGKTLEEIEASFAR
jgi:SP family myo-inositol transporter-like MFS transporter 13